MRHFTKSIPREFFKIGGKLNREERFRWINATGDDGEMCLCFPWAKPKMLPHGKNTVANLFAIFLYEEFIFVYEGFMGET